MTTGFPELVLGDVLMAPFVTYAAAALLAFLVIRPFLYLLAFDRVFANPAAAQVCVYVIILAAFIVVL